MDGNSDESGAYRIYASLHSHEAQLGNLQAGIRALASVWLLSSLGAVAYLLKRPVGAEGGLLVAPGFAIAAVCSLGSLGLAILWVLDQLIYQSFLNAIFALALKMEYDNPRLPPIRTVIALNARQGKGIRPRLQAFYLMPIAVLTILASALLFVDLDGGRLESVKFVPVVLTFFIIAAVVVIGARARQRPLDRARDFGDPKFAAYMENLKRDATMVLKRFDPGD
jgi:hypothetical protein